MSEDAVLMAELLTRLEGEIGRIEEMARGLEDTIGASLSAVVEVPSTLRVALQDLDLLKQTTGDLRLFVATLAHGPMTGGPIPVAAALAQTKLARVREALSGQPASGIVAEPTVFF